MSGKLSRHVTDAGLIARFYGLASDEEHLQSCASCQARLQEIQQNRALFADAPEISFEFLAAQRRAIYSRLGQNEPIAMQVWAPAALVVIVAMSIFLLRPVRTSLPLIKSTSPAVETDLQLFTDVYAMEQSPEPRAAGPIRGLFKEEEQ